MSGDFDNDGTADIIGAQANGSVSFFRGTGSPGTAKLASAASLGSHWMRYDRVLSGDFDRDGKTDLIGRRHNGQLLFHRGAGSLARPDFAAGVQFNSGWQIFDTLLAGDFDRDGHDDIVARKPAGTLHFYQGSVRPVRPRSPAVSSSTPDGRSSTPFSPETSTETAMTTSSPANLPEPSTSTKESAHPVPQRCKAEPSSTRMADLRHPSRRRLRPRRP